MIAFRIDKGTGVPTYRQLVEQVRHAVRVGILGPGDQLPTVREVVHLLAINPNTVHRAYRELELLGIVFARQGQGTFVVDPVPSDLVRPPAALEKRLERWVDEARDAGLDDNTIRALVAAALERSRGRGRR